MLACCSFIAPPAKAEEMYAPETFERSGMEWDAVEVRQGWATCGRAQRWRRGARALSSAR